MSRRLPDGMMTGNARGELVRVFVPRWWQLWRWVRWWWRRHAQTEVEIVWAVTTDPPTRGRITVRAELLASGLLQGKPLTEVAALDWAHAPKKRRRR